MGPSPGQSSAKWYGETDWVVYAKLVYKDNADKKFQLYQAESGTAPGVVGERLMVKNDTQIMSYLTRKKAQKENQLKLKNPFAGQKELVSNTERVWNTALGTPWNSAGGGATSVVFVVNLNFPYDEGTFERAPEHAAVQEGQTPEAGGTR